MNISQAIDPEPDIIFEVKKSYNRILKRMLEAEKYLGNQDIPLLERERHLPALKIEILLPLEEYLTLFKEWGIDVSVEEIKGGFNVETF